MSESILPCDVRWHLEAYLHHMNVFCLNLSPCHPSYFAILSRQAPRLFVVGDVITSVVPHTNIRCRWRAILATKLLHRSQPSSWGLSYCPWRLVAMTTQETPLFIAQEAICFYPISTIYGPCPRYLFYALLLASCVTRWTGWLTDVLLGAAATYAGVAAIQTFILVSSPSKLQDPNPVTIPYISRNTTLWSDFPQLMTDTDTVFVQPAALELDSDAVLAVVITGYLIFLPLQCWSRVLSQERIRVILFSLWNALMLAGSICGLVYSTTRTSIPSQYMFCFPDLPPFDESTSDGWHASWRNSTWNSSVWATFSSPRIWGQLGDICYNPCFNTSQILRQQTSLTSWVASQSDELAHPRSFWGKLIYSKSYIYSLIAVSVILNFIILLFRFLQYRSSIPALNIVIIWRKRRDIWKDFKQMSKEAKEMVRQGDREPAQESSVWRRIRGILTLRLFRQCTNILLDITLLLSIWLSMIISPLTVIAFVVWIEWCIQNDGPSQESPQQVGQWSYLVSIGLLLVSAIILRFKYKVSSPEELELEVQDLRDRLRSMEARRDAATASESSANIVDFDHFRVVHGS